MRKLTLIVAALAALTCGVVWSDVHFETAKALSKIFRNEGGYQCDPKDSGNWTGGKVGKGQLVGTGPGGLAGSVYYEYFKKRGKTMKQVTLTDAALVYDRDYAKPLRLQEIKSQALGTMFLDTAINCGPGVTAILAARSINILNGLDADVPVDPVLGKAEIDWINSYTQTRFWEGQKDRTRRELFKAVFRQERSKRYVAIVRHDPVKLKYLPTWLERTYE